MVVRAYVLQSKGWWVAIWKKYHASIKEILNQYGQYDGRPLVLNSEAAKLLRSATTDDKTKEGRVRVKVDEEELWRLVERKRGSRQKGSGKKKKQKTRVGRKKRMSQSRITA